jgi:hypothetical protein
MSENPHEVWSATVDHGTYAVTVVRSGERSADLTVTHVASDEVILTREVGLAYGAFFGPDVSDVTEWQEMSLAAIDEWAATHSGEDP